MAFNAALENHAAAHLRTQPKGPSPVVPEHVAIIMDGNGRWAQARGLPRTAGHRKGVEAVRAAVRAAGELGVKTLTLFSFSSENWSRPSAEVGELMRLLKLFIRRDLADLHKENVRVSIIGARHNVPNDILPLLEEAERLTRNNTSTRLVIAFNYGGRDEIVRAARRLAEKAAAGEIVAEDICADVLSEALDTADWSDPDLIIRTSGERRLSNFLLWQAAYSEFVFLDCMWPDFDKTHLELALREFYARDRRFGAVAVEAGA
ncbi:MAG: isoprenyl transferase [Pseudomonadota bacterium]